MNPYGQMAMDFAQEHRPVAFAQLEDPVEFFSRAGEEIAALVREVADQLAVSRPADGRAQLRRMAEELVLADHWLLVPEEADQDDPAEDDPTVAAQDRLLAGVNEVINRPW